MVHTPTDATRQIVAVLSAHRIPVPAIGRAIGISENTLRKHYQDEINEGRGIADAQVITCAYRMAVSGMHPAMTMFWLKTQLGWREVTRVETTGPDGTPIEQSLTIRVQYADVDTNTTSVASGTEGDQEPGTSV